MLLPVLKGLLEMQTHLGATSDRVREAWEIAEGKVDSSYLSGGRWFLWASLPQFTSGSVYKWVSGAQCPQDS